MQWRKQMTLLSDEPHMKIKVSPIWHHHHLRQDRYLIQRCSCLLAWKAEETPRWSVDRVGDSDRKSTMLFRPEHIATVGLESIAPKSTCDDDSRPFLPYLHIPQLANALPRQKVSYWWRVIFMFQILCKPSLSPYCHAMLFYDKNSPLTWSFLGEMLGRR